MRVGIYALFLILLQAFNFTFQYNIAGWFYKDASYQVNELTFCSSLLRVFILNGPWILPNAFFTLYSFL